MSGDLVIVTLILAGIGFLYTFYRCYRAFVSVRRENQCAWYHWAGLILSVAILCVLPRITIRTGSTSGEGTSTGVIVNVGHEGALWKMPVIYLVHAGEVKAEAFGIAPDLVEYAEHYAQTGERVQVHYESYYLRWAWTSAENDLIDGIGPADDDEPHPAPDPGDDPDGDIDGHRAPEALP